MKERMSFGSRVARGLIGVVALTVGGAAYGKTSPSFAPGILVASAILLLTAAQGRNRGKPERAATWFLGVMVLVGAVSYLCLSAGIAAHPNSNIPGAIGLISAPFFWLSAPALVFGDLIWVAAAAWDALATGD
jgi:hypothetical protein